MLVLPCVFYARGHILISKNAAYFIYNGERAPHSRLPLFCLPSAAAGKRLTRRSVKMVDQVGRVNGRISDRAEIRTPNFQLQYLLQLYSKSLTIVLERFT